jgi:hypothetical protein
MQPAPAATLFHDAIGVEPLGDGRYGAALGTVWTVGGRAHGGILLVLLAQAGLARLAAELPDPEPLVIAADFLRAPEPGPVELTTEVVKLGRTVSVVSVRMTQGGVPMLTASLTAGRLPVDEPRWAELPDMPADPPAGAFDPGTGGDPTGLSVACDLRFDASSMSFMGGEPGPPLIRGWARPRDEPTDVLFALLAGDLLPPTVFNIGGRIGWAPTVQLTALLRTRPAPGWLRLESRAKVAAGDWFDEDMTVVDSAGLLVCQARQLALSPRPRQ